MSPVNHDFYFAIRKGFTRGKIAKPNTIEYNAIASLLAYIAKLERDAGITHPNESRPSIRLSDSD